MTLDKTIKYIRRVVEENKYRTKHPVIHRNDKDEINACIKCAEEHEQLANWLEELKDYRRFNGAKTFDNGFKQGEKYGYNKAIDDLTNKLTSDEFQKYNLDFVFETSKYLSYNECISAFCEYIEKIAEELKKYKTLNIVHCKDCKHWGTGVAGETENIKCCEYGKYMVGKHGFCCYAEKECEE